MMNELHAASFFLPSFSCIALHCIAFVVVVVVYIQSDRLHRARRRYVCRLLASADSFTLSFCLWRFVFFSFHPNSLASPHSTSSNCCYTSIRRASVSTTNPCPTCRKILSTHLPPSSSQSILVHAGSKAVKMIKYDFLTRK